MAQIERKLIPYLHFQGDCEQALNHYAESLGGEIVDIRRYDGAPMEVPEDYKHKVLHALFTFGDYSLMASDVFPGQQVSPGSRVELTIDLNDQTEARRIFDRLSTGGKVTMPMEEQFWGALYGKLIDPFGIAWMVNCRLEE